jgi:hypothetical protein
MYRNKVSREFSESARDDLAYLGHVNIVTGGLPASIVSGLRLDSNGLSRTDGLAEFTS